MLKKCLQHIILAILVILQTIYEKKTLIPAHSVLLNDIRDNLEHITISNFLL